MFGLPRKTLSLIIATCTLLAGCQRGPNPADTVRNAYGWYLRELRVELTRWSKNELSSKNS